MEKHSINYEKKVIKLEQFEMLKIPPIPEENFLKIGELLNDIVLNYNFDTFSFVFELGELKKNKSLFETFSKTELNSLELTEKYHGSNCTGFSLLFIKMAHDANITGIHLIPSIGEQYVAIEADAYSEIRTTGLVVLVNDKGIKNPFFLAPGLTIDKPIKIDEGSFTESFNRLHKIKEVTEKGFTLESQSSLGKTISRKFFYSEIINPDESYQKNLLRTRTHYQITKQFDNTRIQIAFDFISRTFKLKTPDEELNLLSEMMLSYINSSTGTSFLNKFKNPHLLTGLVNFIYLIDEIQDTLLLPELQNIIKSHENTN